ncbi:MAG: response regulator [bacterium]|nr:response regulator [bacterium]MDT8395028.1 response regulator [bacterium]
MNYRILVVDDEEGIRELYRMQMESAGYEVLTAVDSRGTMEALKNHTVHLVVLDIRLKGESGLELLQDISREQSHVPVILSSAYSSFRSDFSSWLAEGYVVKSSDSHELLDEISKVLEKRYGKGRKKG